MHQMLFYIWRITNVDWYRLDSFIKKKFALEDNSILYLKFQLCKIFTFPFMLFLITYFPLKI